MNEYNIRVDWGFPGAYRDITVFADSEEEAIKYAEAEAASYFGFTVMDCVECEED